MTVSLKHRLQLRFILLSLAALLILQSLIVGFSLWRNYRQITLKADRMIMTIISDPDSSEVADARPRACTAASICVHSSASTSRVRYPPRQWNTSPGCFLRSA